ncbi:cytochrome P450 [Amycolatopsis anabasis]|uniref:cytochrome P450 n=1 Tax=Amycolatopsis anabasis TaxID=1840409 RepID=UPI00131B720E|nr:cytochrome P450 [Amycolatopsis anabasis]
MTMLADNWGVSESQFWLRGETPGEPVQFAPEQGMWNVYGYPETIEILSDPATFSSDTGRVVPESIAPDKDETAEGNLIRLDPPEHNKLRKLVSHAFTPKVVADLEPRIAALTRELLDAADGTRIDLVADLAYPLPVIVIAELLGVPGSDRNLFKQWVDKMIEASKDFSLTEQSEAQKAKLAVSREQRKLLTDYLGEHAADRRRHPREDLLTKLVESEVDGERLTANQIVNFAALLLVAGHITTTMLLGNTVLCLDAHPGQLARVRADRSTVPGAIEESLRFLSPFATLARVTNRDVELGGVAVPADQMLLLWIAAANRDPRQFADPHTFDPCRDPNPQVGFGRGVHFCLGAPLARLEGRIALNILLDRYPALRTDPERPPEFIDSPNMTGVSKLPLLLA